MVFALWRADVLGVRQAARETFRSPNREVKRITNSYQAICIPFPLTVNAINRLLYCIYFVIRSIRLFLFYTSIHHTTICQYLYMVDENISCHQFLRYCHESIIPMCSTCKAEPKSLVLECSNKLKQPWFVLAYYLSLSWHVEKAISRMINILKYFSLYKLISVKIIFDHLMGFPTLNTVISLFCQYLGWPCYDTTFLSAVITFARA